MADECFRVSAFAHVIQLDNLALKARSRHRRSIPRLHAIAEHLRTDLLDVGEHAG